MWRDVGLETSSVIAVPAGQSQVLCHCRFHRSGTVPCYFHRSVAVLCHCRSSLLFPQITQSSVSVSLPISQSQFLVVPTGQSQFCVSVVITVPCHCRSHRSVCSPSCHSHMSVTVVSLSFPQVSHSSLSLSFPRVSNTYADKVSGFRNDDACCQILCTLTFCSCEFSDVTLTAKMQYSTFVRAWYSDGSHAVFKSSGITPIVFAPTTTNLVGRAVSHWLRCSSYKLMTVPLTSGVTPIVPAPTPTNLVGRAVSRYGVQLIF